MKAILIASCVTFGAFGLAACDVKAETVSDPVTRTSMIYGEQPKGDQGVSGRCAKIANPAERRKCIQTSG